MRFHHGLSVLLQILLTGSVLNAAEHPGMYVDGRFLYDKCGEKVILRGYNTETIYWDGYGGQTGDWSNAGKSTFTEVAKTGANCCRIFWAHNHAGEGWRMEASMLESTIKNCIDNNMIAMPELHDATGDGTKFGPCVDYWCSSDIVAVIKKYEDKVLVNIANEVNFTTAEAWVSAYSDAVVRMRTAGIHTPIVIDGGNTWSQYEAEMVNNAQAIIDADPDHNLIFSWHTYIPAEIPDGSKEKIKAAMDSAIKKNICMIIGEFGRVSAWPAYWQKPVNWEYIMEYAQESQTGWLVWTWYMGGWSDEHSVTTDRMYGNWANNGFGEQLTISSPYSIKNTAHRTSYFVNGACATTGPKARIASNISSGALPLPVDFDGSGSTGTIVNYTWKFGDGGSANGAKPSHTYTTAGSFTVTLIVTDGSTTDSAKATIAVTDPTLEPPVRTINDSTVGNSLNHFNFTGAWSVATGSNAFAGDEHWTTDTTACYSLAFYGKQVVLYGTKDAHHGIGSVSIDNGTATDVDLYAATRSPNSPLWTSPLLTLGNHTVRMCATSRKNSLSTGKVLVADRIDIMQNTGATAAAIRQSLKRGNSLQAVKRRAGYQLDGRRLGPSANRSNRIELWKDPVRGVIKKQIKLHW